MKLLSIDTGNFKADGGAVFGVIPKVMWSKTYPCDENNYLNLTMRSLLVDDGERCMIVDTGIGTKQDERFLSYQHLNGEATLPKSVNEAGYSFDAITDVILTHLHFDHCGGCVYRDKTGELKLLFPNATHWVSKAQWENYSNPNSREGAVYFKENMLPVLEAGKLQLIEDDYSINDTVFLKLFNGHTPGQIIPHFNTGKETVVFMGDLIPVKPSVNPLWVAAYDVNPIVSIEEKEGFIKEAHEKNYVLFFEHDLIDECCRVEKTEKGLKPSTGFKLSSLNA